MSIKTVYESKASTGEQTCFPANMVLFGLSFLKINCNFLHI